MIVPGDPAALHATAAWLATVAAATKTVADDLTASVTKSEHAWTGAGGDAFRFKIRNSRAKADDLRRVSHDRSMSVTAFANEIRAVKHDMTAAKDLARAAGFRVTETTIQFPLPMLEPGASGPSGMVTAMVAQARRREAAAHTALRTALGRHKSFYESLPTLPRALSVGRGLFNAAIDSDAFTTRASARATALTEAAFIAENSESSLRQSAQAKLFGGTAAGVLDQVAFTSRDALKYGPANHVQLPTGAKSGPIAAAALKTFAVSSGVIAGAGIGLDLAAGMPADKAVVKGGASFAAGATAAVLLEAGAIILLGSTPPGLVVLAVSTVVSAGVGYSIDQAGH
ncbi:hypothetical protein AB0E55_37480 [Amycolatopsis keratiniphila]|uniref:WXG100-like domain-containing protein n=1 Tax=Amycolatopsis keratiniphila TaxID=129921 RepID=UPI00340EB179